MMNNVADPETNSLMSLVYDQFTYGPIKGLRCDWTDENTVRSMYCEIEDQKRYIVDKQAKQFQLEAAEIEKNETPVAKTDNDRKEAEKNVS